MGLPGSVDVLYCLCTRRRVRNVYLRVPTNCCCCSHLQVAYISVSIIPLVTLASAKPDEVCTRCIGITPTIVHQALVFIVTHDVRITARSIIARVAVTVIRSYCVDTSGMHRITFIHSKFTLVDIHTRISCASHPSRPLATPASK